MAEISKVIRGLEICEQSAKMCFGETECAYQSEFPRCWTNLAHDALALLKEQEPRVMTWDELMRCADGDPAFIEARDRSCCWVLIRPTYIGMIGKNGYGVRWRYWTSRPSPNQMRDTPWEPPKEEDCED